MSNRILIFLLFIWYAIGLLCSCNKLAKHSASDNLCAVPDSIRISPDESNQRILKWRQTNSLRATNGDTMAQASNGEWVRLDRSRIPFIFKVYKVKNPDINIEKLIHYYSLKSKRIIKSFDCVPMGKWSMEEDIVRWEMDTIYSHVASDYLVPNFVGEYNVREPWCDASSKSGLDSSYNFYIIKSGSDFILPNGELVYRWWLPDSLQHGYRSGVAISKKIEYIVCFAIAW